MSTGAPSPSVESIPPSKHNHGHSHSHGRGHSRANRWSQPPPLPRPTEAHLHELPEPINALNASYSYGHTHQDSGYSHQTHAHAHSHSHSHSSTLPNYDHSHSVSSIHHDHHDSHDHHNHHAHDHGAKCSNESYGIASAGINQEAAHPSEKTYVIQDPLEELGLINLIVRNCGPVHLSCCHGLHYRGIKDNAPKERTQRAKISARPHLAYTLRMSTRRLVC